MPLDPKVIRDIYGDRDPLVNPFPTAKEYNPDQMAEGLKLGRAKGIDGVLAADNLPQLNEELAQDKWDEVVKNSPKLARRMQDPAFAAVAQDDTDNLGLVDKAIRFTKTLGGDVKAGVTGFNEGFYGVAQAASEVGATILDPLVGTILPENPLGRMAEASRSARTTQKDIKTAIQKARGDMGSTEQAFHSGIESATQSLLTLPLAILSRNPNVLSGVMAGSVAGQSFGEARDDGKSLGQAIPFATSQAYIEYATEQIPAAKLLTDLKLKSGFMETAKNFLAREIPGEQLATVMQDLNEWAVLNPEKPFSSYLAERPEAAYQTAVATVVGGSVQVGAAKAIDAVASRFVDQDKAAQDATQHRETLAQLDQLASESLVRARDPESFKQFVASAIEDGPVSDVYVDAQTLAQTGADTLAQLSPEVQAGYAEALATGGSVQIPLEEFLTHVAGTETGTQILDHVKIDPNGMTFAESEAFQQNYQAEFNAQVAKATEDKQADANFKASAAEVKAILKEQLNAVGHSSPTVNDTYATMASSYYAIRAAQLGISPKELFDQHPLSVVGERMAGGLDQANAQIETPQFKEWFGDSKVVDTEGKPLVVYHQTAKAFDTFDMNKTQDSLFWFTSDKNAEVGAASAREVMPVYLTLKNPATRAEYDKYNIDQLISKGFDGITLEDGIYVAFDPEQIKSAVGNNGNFDPNDPNILNQAAYHGTPYKFDKFSLDHIGSGEGAQAYGWGLYFAGDKQVAEYYRKTLSQDSYNFAPVRYFKGQKLEKGSPENHAATLMSRNGMTLKQARADVTRWIAEDEQDERQNSHVAGLRRTLEVLNEATSKKDFTEKPYQGVLYEVNIPEDDTYLLWDKSLADQSEKVKAALASKFSMESFTADYATAAEFYRSRVRKFDSPREASKELNALGVSGIKYLDGSSRSAGEGSYNYVVFDDQAVEILNTFYQNNRGAYSPNENTISLLKNADLSTFLHELGHAFLTMDTQFVGQILSKDTPATEAEQQLINDLETVFDWFGLEGNVEQQLIQWNSMSVDEQRASHEKFAEGFEAYLFEGKAPSLALQEIFQRFRAWLANVYRNITSFLDEAGETLTPEVRGVFDRMLATTEQINIAQQARGMAPLFDNAEDAGMTPEQFAQYQKDNLQSSQDAISELEAKSLRDMTWTSRLKEKTVKRLNKEAAALRREVRIEARREVLQEPLYKAWQYLTSKQPRDEAVKVAKDKGLNPEVDSLMVAIAKLGGINKSALTSNWGLDPKTPEPTNLFGKFAFRKTGGVSIDTMGEYLAEQGYLSVDENGKYDMHEFEDKFNEELRGAEQYSYAYNYAAKFDGYAGGVEVNPMQAGRLDRAEVRALIGDKVDKLDKFKMLRADGLPADVVAEAFGFQSGEEMIRALADATPLRDEIEALTDQKMLEQHGELATPEAISKAADAAIHTDVRTRAIATELAGLQKALGSAQALSRMAKDYARAVVGKTRVKDLRPAKFAADAARAGRQADVALRKGNREEAITQKRNQLVNHATTRVAYDTQAEVRKIEQQFRKIVSAKMDNLKATHNLDLVNTARAILAEYGIGTRGQSPIAYLELVKAYDPELYAALEPDIRQAQENPRQIKDLTIDELRALRDQVDSIWYLAKREKQVEIDGKMVDREAVVGALSNRLYDLGIPDEVPGEKHAVTEKEKAARTLRGFRASLRRVEAWVDRMDSGDITGAFRKYIFTPISEAADAYRLDSVKTVGKFRDLLNTVAPTLTPGRIAAPELDYTFGYSKGDAGMAELVHAILHTGNESNKRKLLLGRGWATERENKTLDTTKWDTFINRLIDEGRLTKAHFDFAQGVWDLLEETKPIAQKTHREVFGRYFDEVTADSFTNKFGTYRGGYVPAITDTFEVQDAAINQALDDVNAGNAYMFPATSRGFTKSRVEYNRPLALDLRLLPQHIDKVLLFAHMERHVRDVQRILRKSQGLLNRYDPVAYTDMLLPWLNRAAKQVVQTPSTGVAGKAADKFWAAARSRAGMSTMFANLTNALQQITGFSLTALKVKPTYLRSAMAQYIKSPSDTAKAVGELSPFMSDRLDRQSFQLRGEIEDMLLNPSKYEQVSNWTQKHAYFLQSAFQNTVDLISWQGAYNQALAQGESDNDAVRFANSVVRETQGSLQPEDISRFESGSPFIRIFTQFASYFNMQANILGTEFAVVSQELGLRKGAGKAFYIMLFGFLVPAWVADGIVRGMRGGGGDGDDEYLDEWLAFIFGAPLRNATAMVPVAGAIANRAAAGFTPQQYDDRMATAPAISAIESAVNAPSSIYEAIADGGRAKPAIKDSLTLITMMTGIPVSALGKPLGYVADVGQGNVEPTGPLDMARGLVTGVASEESKR